ncbi:chromosome partitioning protein ParB [bacterium]|nr:MAG: chromosome partitioning protein ParB [bacterium]
MKITTPTRIIRYDDRVLADLNPAASIEDVVRMHAATIPALATAVVEGPENEHGKATYTVRTRLGTKG